MLDKVAKYVKIASKVVLNPAVSAWASEWEGTLQLLKPRPLAHLNCQSNVRRSQKFSGEEHSPSTEQTNFQTTVTPEVLGQLTRFKQFCTLRYDVQVTSSGVKKGEMWRCESSSQADDCKQRNPIYILQRRSSLTMSWLRRGAPFLVPTTKT